MLKLKNEGNEELMIVSISSDVQIVEVKYNDKLPIYIHPGKEVEFTVKYTPLIYGKNIAYILIKLNNNKGYFYKLTATGVENEFELKPIVIKTNRLGYSESLPVYIKNPYNNQQLIITSIQAQDRKIDIQYSNDEQVCCTRSSSVIIPPMQRLIAFNIAFTLHSSDLIVSIIRIRFQPDTTITLPILIKAKNEVLILPEVVDFGMVDPAHGPHKIMLRSESFHEAATITEIYYKKSPNFALHIYNATQKSISIPKGNKTLGYIGFYAANSGYYESKVYLLINSSKVVKVEIRARVIESSFLHDSNDVLIDVTNKPFNQVHVGTISLKDDLYGFDNVVSSFTDDELIKSRITCQNEEVQYCALKSSVIQLSYRSLNSTTFPLKRHVTLLVANSLLHIQLTFYDTSLLCIFNEYGENGTLELVKKRCSEIERIDLGLFGGSTKYLDLHLMNSNPKAVNVTKLALKNDNAYCCMEILLINKEGSENIFKEWEYGKITEFDEGSILVIQSGSMVILRIYLSLNDCGKSREMKTIDNDSFSNRISFDSGQLPINMKLEYVYHSGDFSFSPSRMRFEPGFPGTTQSKELWAISSFKVPLRILRSWTTDRRIEFQQNIEEITSDSKSELGVVKFSPGNVPEEQHFASLKTRVLSWYDNIITLGELKLWREIQQTWDSISSAGGTLIDSELLVDTNILQGIKLTVKAELTRPILVQDNELNFQLIQNGSRKELSFQIYNPAASPLMVQVFTVDPSSTNYKGNLPLSFFPRGKSCSENYTAWTKKYDMTMQQIRSKRRLTSYSSFEEFAEDYCCYMGRYNSSILYSQKYDELSDNDLSATLSKHCYSKSITQFGQVTALKKNPKATKTKGIWNLVFKEVKPTNEDESLKEDFILPAKYSQSPLIIPPLSYLTIGPIIYSPNTVGIHNGAIFIKNNLTVLYPIKLKGESGVGSLEFIEETNSLLKFNRVISAIPKEHVMLKNVSQSTEVEFRLTQSDLLVESKDSNNPWPSFLRGFFNVEDYPCRVRRSHERVYTVKNSGNIPLVVTKISIEDRGCSAYGISIEDCKGFTLEPQESYKLKVDYTTSLAIFSFKHSLVFHTNSGVQTFELAVRLPFHILTKLQQVPLLEE